MSAGAPSQTDGVDAPPETDGPVPDWDDEYLDRVADRLLHNYDLARDVAVRGERFDLYGQMRMESKKHFLHPSLSYAHHESREHLFVRRLEAPSVADVERLVDLGHDLADAWIDADTEHYGTEFTFALVVPSIPGELRTLVADFRDRTLLKYGFHGHYEINLVVAAPAEETVVASESADVRPAFETWESIEREEPGLLGLIARRLQL